MRLNVNISDQACGAEIIGIDLTNDLSDSQVSAIRDLWLEHHVLSFPNQHLDAVSYTHLTLPTKRIV